MVLTMMVSAAPSIEVTPAMIQAGVFVAREHTLGEPLDDLVARVFSVMAAQASDERSGLLKDDAELGQRVICDVGRK